MTVTDLEAADSAPSREPELCLPLRFTYKNHRGETADRCVIPRELFFGTSAYHPHHQWLLRAHDLDRKEERTFAVCDIIKFL